MDINKIKLDKKFKLVEASAGTGKSFTLAHIVLRNVLEEKIKPEEILLLSFTKNTCSELRGKIISRFNNLKLFIQNEDKNNTDNNNTDNTLINWYLNYKKNEKYPEKLILEIDDFINKIYKLKVTTFHGFCSNLLEEYSIDIGSVQDLYIENNIDSLYQNIIDDLWIDKFLNLEPEIISAITQKKINSTFGTKLNKSFFVKMLKAIDQENICNLQINNKYKSIDISNYLKEFLYINWKEFCNEWNSQGEELFLELITLGKLIKQTGSRSLIYSSKPRNNKFNQILEWIQDINLRLNSEDIVQLISYISCEDLLSKYFYNKNINKEIKKFNINLDLKRFKLLQDKIYKIKDGLYTEFVRIFIQLAYSKLISKKKSLSILNFNDLIKTVENKYLSKDLKNEGSFSDIQNRFKCILVDEFQDTDNIQWNIIKKFFKTKNHFLLCVGDPKQAIYKFRGGDIQTYLEAKNEANDVLNLTDNYRTSNELLNIINKLYGTRLKQSSLDYKKLNSKINSKENSNYDLRNIFEVVEFSNKKINLEELVTQYLVDFIAKNKLNQLNKISILTLYNFQCLELKNKLVKYNIPCQIHNKQNIFDTEASNLLIFLIDCLLNPRIHRNISLLATSKFVEIDKKELLDFKINKKLEILTNQCINWSLELREKGFLTLVNELIINYKSSSIICDKDLYSNLFQLSEIIEIQLINNDFNLDKLYYWYKNQLDDNSRNCVGEDYLTKDYNINDGINISTIHNSKGLEYDIVLCPYLSFISRKSTKTKGPIWKSYLDRSLYINISNSHSKVEDFKLIEEKDLFKESERLIYVALTRSKYKLIVFNDLDDKNNILNNDLLSNLENLSRYKAISDNKIDSIKIKDISNRININKLNDSLWKLEAIKTKRQKNLPSQDIISYSSYSSWIRKDKKTGSELSQYKDYQDNISIINIHKNTKLDTSKIKHNYLNQPNPLSEFPKGTFAGTCLHKIIERYDFNNDNLDQLLELIIEELNFHQIDNSLAFKVREGIIRISKISFGSKLKNKRLLNIPYENILKEVNYDLPLSYEGRKINASDISKCFLLDKNYEFGEDYSKRINDLQILNKGFHSGCIDCIIPIGSTIEDSKWWVFDWKSNFISDSESDKCYPRNYNYKNMKEEMIKHHYPLQAHLYLLALHRLLKWRIKNYQPSIHLGGYVYLFIKGLPDIASFERSKVDELSPGVFIGEAPLNRINYLDTLF